MCRLLFEGFELFFICLCWQLASREMEFGSQSASLKLLPFRPHGFSRRFALPGPPQRRCGRRSFCRRCYRLLPLYSFGFLSNQTSYQCMRYAYTCICMYIYIDRYICTSMCSAQKSGLASHICWCMATCYVYLVFFLHVEFQIPVGVYVFVKHWQILS